MQVEPALSVAMLRIALFAAAFIVASILQGCTKDDDETSVIADPNGRFAANETENASGELDSTGLVGGNASAQVSTSYDPSGQLVKGGAGSKFLALETFTPCELVWQAVADGHTCGNRIQWVMQNEGMTDAQAKSKVATEFPSQCGACKSTTTCQWSKCASEWAWNNVCTCHGHVRFGKGSKWSEAKMVRGSVKCDTNNFNDPSRGVAKECHCGTCDSSTTLMSTTTMRTTTAATTEFKTTPTSTTQPRETCESVWDVDAGGHTCGARIEWLKQNMGMNDAQARSTVADEFPSICGACQSSTPMPTTQTPGTTLTPGPGITILGRQLLVDGTPVHLKGVNWNPVQKGGTHPQNLDFAGFVDQDAKLMSDAGINVLRTYEAITDKRILDTLWSHGIRVLNTVYSWGGAAVSSVDDKVRAVKDHPAILMWVVGNEWNYNGLYYGLSFEDSLARIRDAALRIKDIDSSHPVSTVYGHLPSSATVSALSVIDVWGLNVYSGITFGDLFASWAKISNAPMYLGEYGADAYDANMGEENQDAQAEATRVLTQEIVSNSAVHSGGVCLGGVIFELADEWWKDVAGSPSVHDVGGIAPGGGPHPDATFNEEWWGLVDIDRNPRKAYYEYVKIAVPGVGSTSSHEPWTTEEPTTTETVTKNPGPKTTTQPRDTCQSVWDVDADGHTCGERIEWVQQHQGKTDLQAKSQVADEFPRECGACKPKPVVPCAGPAADVCDVPSGHCAILSGDRFCQEVNVRGTLTIASNSKLTTSKLQVHSQGTLQVGTPQDPAESVAIDLQQNGQLRSSGKVYIYGKPKTSWTTLAAPCDRCDVILVTECSGWEIGDTIVLVGTGNGKNGFVEANADYRTEERKIRSISECRITLDRASDQKHRSEMYKGRVPIKSEVLNMDRSVRIFGTEGIVTRQEHSGIMKVHHARVSNCGQPKVGEYCLHFHHMGPCPECSFVGNAVGWPSMNKGITIHGTSNTLVESNVVYDHKGAFLYLEDGNEIGNTIKNNALICPTVEGCLSTLGPAEHHGSDNGNQAGLYAVSVTNDFVGNHISGMRHAFFQDFQSGSKIWGGSGPVNKKACPSANPFRRVSGNYFHNQARFGFYAPHSSFPTQVKTNENGLVTDWNSCLGFDPFTGKDNSAGYVVENHVEIFHNFGAGGYDGGETSFKNAIFAFGLATTYYKTFRRGIRSGPFCEGCFFTDNLYPTAPGGSCMWEYKDTLFEDTLHKISLNHHCGNDGEWTGGLCASHFWFTGKTEMKPEFKLFNDGFGKAKTYTDSIAWYKGKTYMATNAAHPAFRTDNCVTGQAGGDWTACPHDIRIVRIYSADRGQLRVTSNTEGIAVSVPYTPWQKHPWGRPNAYDLATKYQNGGMGYTFLVRTGHEYTIEVSAQSEMPDFFTLEYSDIQMPGDSITLSVQGGGRIAGGPCTIQSSHNRNWITPYGPYIPESGAWWECRKWAVDYTSVQHREAQAQHFRNNGIQNV